MEGMFDYESDELDQNSFNIYTKSEYIEMIGQLVTRALNFWIVLLMGEMGGYMVANKVGWKFNGKQGEMGVIKLWI